MEGVAESRHASPRLINGNGISVGKGDGEEGDAWIERPSDCSTPGRIGGRGGRGGERRGERGENGSETLLMNGVYDGPR